MMGISRGRSQRLTTRWGEIISCLSLTVCDCKLQTPPVHFLIPYLSDIDHHCLRLMRSINQRNMQETPQSFKYRILI